MKIYFMGICGTAMGNAALLARAAGHEVGGADAGVYPPMSTVLAETGISIHEGYDPQRLAQLRPDLVVVGNAMSRGNPELEWLLDTRQFRMTSLPAFLSEFVLAQRRNVVICGTHGKTTTTALCAFLLEENGQKPGFLIGGVPNDPPVGHQLGRPESTFVIEGDEYDSAFFDKRSKFIHYQPRVAVLNNLEFDHADIFHDLRDVQRTFSHLTRIVPRSGWIVVNGDDANLAALGDFPWTRCLRVGTGDHNDVQIREFTENARGATFALWAQGKRWHDVQWGLPGLFNARNAAMAATAATLATQIEAFAPGCLPLEALMRFRGVKRRQEIHIDRPELTVVEDFGHHPTALRETIQSLRARHPQQRICAVFEPRSNTARTKVLQADFTSALTTADEIYIGAVNRADKLKEGERFDAAAVELTARQLGKFALAGSSNEEVLQVLEKRTRSTPGALVVFFSNGSFDGIIGRFVRSFR